MIIEPDADLIALNTFHIQVQAEKLVHIHSIDEIKSKIKKFGLPALILGSGSNILFTKNIKGYVLKNEIMGIKILRRFKTKIWIEVAGGEIWHEVVLWALKNNLGGIENLSLIPGTMGAAPIQNIGAYGVELKDVFVKAKVIELATGKIKIFDRKKSDFGYRESFFKKEGRGKYFICSVVLSLTSVNHKLNTSYGDIQKNLATKMIADPTIQDISQAVIEIRKSKLPDPTIIGNAGSFFKNPVISKKQFEELKNNFPDIPSYRQNDGTLKIAAGWLVEQCGWKGKRVGDAGCHEKQALVLVNYGNATGSEILSIARTIQNDVFEKFKIQIQPEVNVL